MNRNIYYHLSGYKDITILEPTIPTHALEKENKTISRISIGLSVGDCLKGLAPIEVNIDSFIEEERLKGNDPYKTIIDNKAIDTDIKEFFVYEVRSSQEVYQPGEDLVPDAMGTGEYWLLREQKVSCLGKVKRLRIFPKVFDIRSQYIRCGERFQIFEWEYSFEIL